MPIRANDKRKQSFARLKRLHLPPISSFSYGRLIIACIISTDTARFLVLGCGLILKFLNGERYLTDKEVSEKLKVSRRTLQDYRNEGKISYCQLGGKILYRESDIEKMLEDNYFPAIE
jgi:excisionase family DNA binding protein